MTNIDIIIIIGALLLSMICGFLSIPLILNYCKKEKLYDAPNSRKMHKIPVPRLGGISFMPSMLIAVIIALFVLNKNSDGHNTQINLWSLYFLISLFIIYIVGLIDDLIGLNASIKFTVQSIAATIIPLSGLYINNLYGLFGIHDIPFWVGVPLTVFIIVFIDNAMNLIDGIDGLCAGISVIALIGFMIGFYTEGLEVYCIMIASMIGVLIPYLYFNLFGKVENNRKIFMGDSGSLTLGFILSVLFIKYSMDNPNVMHFYLSRMPIGYSLLIIPTFDVVRIILYRIRNHRSIFDADKNHIHHKLMRIGISMHNTLIIILIIDIAFVVINILLYPKLGFTIIFLLDIFIYTLFHLILNYYIGKRRKKEII